MVKSVLTVPLMPRRPIQTGSGPHFRPRQGWCGRSPKKDGKERQNLKFESFGSYYLLYVYGAGHLRGSRLLSFFAFYCEKNVVCVGGGGGVGGDNNVICTSTHMWCNISVRSLAFHALPHIRPATLLSILLHFHTYVMLRCRYSCTSTHVSCYAAVDSLALPHIRHATL